MSVFSSNSNAVVWMKLYVNKDNFALREIYKNHVKQHNDKVNSTNYPDSGFDLFVPNDVSFYEENGINSVFVNMEVKVEMTNEFKQPCPFEIHPRSSIAKTPLLLANNTGIIDMGYRGFIMSPFRNLSPSKYFVAQHTRLVQICHPSKCPILIEMVEDESHLTSTERGDGGFGSTGTVGINVPMTEQVSNP
jgi:dUTPase